MRELNLRAQAARGGSGASVGLADGCSAYVGDAVISRRNDRRLGVSGSDWVKNGDRWLIDAVRADGSLSVRHTISRLHATLPASYVVEHVELGCASTVHAAQSITTDVVHGIVSGTEDRQMLYTMLTRGRVENHAHIVLDTDETHALPSPTDRAMSATEVLEGILARDGAAVSATSTQARATSAAAQLQDAVARYADTVALAMSQLRANPDLAEPGPLPWLAGIPSEVASHSAWAPYLAARSRRISSLAAEVAADPELPGWTAKYDDVLTPDLRHELAVWRAATGVPAGERTMAGPVPHDDWEAAYHRNLTGRINARYGEALKVWQDRVVDNVGRRDEQTRELAKYLDQLARRGVDAERVLDLAASRKPLPVDNPTAALEYRVKDLATPSKQRRPAPSIDPFPGSLQRDSGPSLGL